MAKRIPNKTPANRFVMLPPDDEALLEVLVAEFAKPRRELFLEHGELVRRTRLLVQTPCSLQRIRIILVLSGLFDVEDRDAPERSRVTRSNEVW